MKKKIYLLIFFLLGAFSLSTQTILIREYLLSFEGNELGLGVFYASWFLWIGIGAVFTIKRQNFFEKYFLKIVSFYPLFSIFQFWIFRSLRGVAGIFPWEFFPLQRLIPLTFIFNAPFSLLTGIIFSTACIFIGNLEKPLSGIISKAYIYESFGSFLSGIGVTILISKLLNPLSILLISILLYLGFVLGIALHKKDKAASLFALCGIIFSVFSMSPQGQFIEKSDQLRWKYTFPDAELIEEVYSPYQHIKIARYDNEIIVLLNTKIITSLPDKTSADEMAAIFLAMQNMPKDILIIGYGAENCIASLLDSPINSLEYLNQDPEYARIIKKYLPYDLAIAFNDSRFKFISKDPFIYLRKTQKKYDLIIINLPDPSTLNLNKYYTYEFFQDVKKSLYETGAMATRITAAENFLGSEIRNYGSSIYYTLRNVFDKTCLIPGDTTWFFSGSNKSPITEDAKTLSERYKNILPSQSTFHPEGFYSLLLDARLKLAKEAYLDNPIFKNGRLINSENNPLSYFLNLLILGRYSNHYLVGIFKEAFLSGWVIFFAPIVFLLLLRLHYLVFIQSNQITISVFNAKTFQFFSGACGFIYYIILLFMFQSKFGTLFLFIGFVNALFMIGLLGGSFAGRKLILYYKTIKLIFCLFIIQIILYLVTIPLLTNIASKTTMPLLFFLLFLGAGLFTGASYPLAGKILEDKKNSLLTLGASLESLDHWGAALGAITAGIIIIPLLGIFKTLLLLILVSAAILLLFTLETIWGNKKIKKKEVRFSNPYIKTSYLLFAISVFFLFTFNYLNKKKDFLSADSPRLTSVLSGFELSGIKTILSPIKHYSAHNKDGIFYIFESKNFCINNNGFSGPTHITLVLDENKTIVKAILSESNDTKAYIERVENWLDTLKGENIAQFLYANKNVDAITGATYTSSAAIKTVKDMSTLILDAFGGAKEEIGVRKKAFRGIAKSFIFLIFTLIAIVLFHKKCSRKTKMIYYLFLVIILGFLLKMQFSSLQIFNILTGSFPELKNLPLFLIAFLPLILALFYGRFYCGWLCPFGAIQELIGNTPLNRLPEKNFDRKARYIKYVYFALIIVLVSLSKNTQLFDNEPLSRIFTLFTRSGIKNLLLFIVLFFSLFALRFWCKYFCIVGALLSLFNKFALIKRAQEKNFLRCKLNISSRRDLDCIQCQRCFEDEK